MAFPSSEYWAHRPLKIKIDKINAARVSTYCFYSLKMSFVIMILMLMFPYNTLSTCLQNLHRNRSKYWMLFTWNFLPSCMCVIWKQHIRITITCMLMVPDHVSLFVTQKKRKTHFILKKQQNVEVCFCIPYKCTRLGQHCHS